MTDTEKRIQELRSEIEKLKQEGEGRQKQILDLMSEIVILQKALRKLIQQDRSAQGQRHYDEILKDMDNKGDAK